ncbi:MULTISPECIES: hypothetical protein [unclassified Streptomyces]|uniref:hypothetical protein n=1 Tax=unclassified Streptomyces TaxID=2593676 RepID=UPI003869C1F4|nr:hypothetical protein OG569_11630 [Streptomyces sp. NBC_00827]
MDWRYMLGLAEGVVLGVLFSAGIAAVRGGWVPRATRGRVIRRRLWGQGLLVLTASLALPLIALALLGAGALYFAASLAGGTGMITGAVLMHRATRDRRRGSAATGAY